MQLRLFTPMLAVGLALALGACTAVSPAPRGALQAVPAAVASVAPTPTPTPSQEPLTLVTMGASDVTGLGADDPETEGWAPVLASALTGSAAHVRLGFPGWTARQIRASVLDQAVKARPDVVVLWTGVNDFNAGVSVEAFTTELDAMLEALAETGAQVYVLNMPDLDRLPAFTSAAASIRPAMPVWRKAIETTAERHKATVIALTPYSDEIGTHAEYISSDGFHPSTQGYKRLAAIIAAAMGRE